MAPATLDKSATEGMELAVLDRQALVRLSAVLRPETVRTYLERLAWSIEALLRGLETCDGTRETVSDLAKATHALIGSAGNFGFDRLVFVGRHFEYAIRSDPSMYRGLADGLKQVLSMSLAALREAAA